MRFIQSFLFFAIVALAISTTLVAENFRNDILVTGNKMQDEINVATSAPSDSTNQEGKALFDIVVEPGPARSHDLYMNIAIISGAIMGCLMFILIAQLFIKMLATRRDN